MTWWRENGDFVWIPLLVLALVWLDTTRFTVQWAVQVAGGLTLFTLVEYLVHRFVLHGPLWLGKHERHHTHPQEKVIFPWYFTPFALTPGVALLPFAMAVGFLLGAIWFFGWHYALHQWFRLDALRARKTSIAAASAAWHDLHHKDLPVNYGITQPLWDLVFGTYMSTEQGQTALLKRAAKRAVKRAMEKYNAVR